MREEEKNLLNKSLVYGSIFTNETAWDRTPKGHARHIACPQRLKYIHGIDEMYYCSFSYSIFIEI